MKSWIYNDIEQDKVTSYAEFKINEDTTIIVGSRPDSSGVHENFAKSIDAWLNVTDRYVDYPHEFKVRWQPWYEKEPLSLLHIYSTLNTLYQWVFVQKFKRIYIHCDAGTHRAPTTLGAFLYTFFPKTYKDIVATHKLVNRNHLSDPVRYFKTYIVENNNIEPFVKAMRKFAFEKEQDYWSYEQILNAMTAKGYEKLRKEYKE